MTPRDLTLVLGPETRRRVIPEPEKLLFEFRNDAGFLYYGHIPATPPNTLVVEDLAVTALVSSQFGWRAVQSVIERGSSLELGELPNVPLQDTSPADRQQLSVLISDLAAWPGFAASVATKVLHKKRPALIPILDNQAIFGAYMAASWPETRALSNSVWDTNRIRAALDQLFIDLTAPANLEAWSALELLEPGFTRIELFDAVWWTYFRLHQPVHPTS